MRGAGIVKKENDYTRELFHFRKNKIQIKYIKKKKNNYF